MRLRRAPHFCEEWDGMEVAPWHHEAACCQCETYWWRWPAFWWAWLRRRWRGERYL